MVHFSSISTSTLLTDFNHAKQKVDLNLFEAKNMTLFISSHR
jgi:hypothetical protein